jgi:hypothetical protein
MHSLAETSRYHYSNGNENNTVVKYIIDCDGMSSNLGCCTKKPKHIELQL